MMNTRMTNQRLMVLQHLQSVKTHPTAEMVYYEVVKRLPNMTLATAYRNLNLLASQGQILKLEINKEFHFDADMSSHQHCVCKECGKITDQFQKEISDYAMKKIHTDMFHPESVNVIFYGKCKNCQRGGK